MLSFYREDFCRIYPELLPLAEQHYKEIAWRQDKIPLSVDYQRYKTMVDIGRLVTFTGRDVNRLVAYAVFLVDQHIHYDQTKFAMNDVIFVHPQYRNRGNGQGLIRFCKSELTSLGVQVMTFHVKPQLDFGPLLAAEGFDPGDKIWQKWLGE